MILKNLKKKIKVKYYVKKSNFKIKKKLNTLLSKLNPYFLMF